MGKAVMCEEDSSVKGLCGCWFDGVRYRVTGIVRHVSVLLGLLFGVCGAVLAQTAGNTKDAMEKTGTVLIEGGGFFAGMEGVGRAISRRLTELSTSRLVDAGLSYSDALTAPALMVGGSLALLYLMAEFISLLASKRTAPLQILVDTGLAMTVTALLVTNYRSFAVELNSLLNVLRNLAGDTNTVMVRVVDLYASVLKLASESISVAFSNAGGTFFSLDVGSALAALADLLLCVLFCLAVLGIVLFGLAEIAGLVLLGPFLFAVGLAFGPFFIAGLATPWTREFATKWVGFMVGAATLTGVLGIVIAIASNIFTHLSFEAASTAQEITSAGQMAIAAVLLLAVNSIIAQAPAIASALVPGAIGARTGAGRSVVATAVGVGHTASGTAKTAVRYAKAGMARIP